MRHLKKKLKNELEISKIGCIFALWKYGAAMVATGIRMY